MEARSYFEKKCVCVLYFPLAQPGHGNMAAVLETTCRSIYRASIYVGRRWPFNICYNIVHGPVSAMADCVENGLVKTVLAHRLRRGRMKRADFLIFARVLLSLHSLPLFPSAYAFITSLK